MALNNSSFITKEKKSVGLGYFSIVFVFKQLTLVFFKYKVQISVFLRSRRTVLSSLQSGVLLQACPATLQLPNI